MATKKQAKTGEPIGVDPNLSPVEQAAEILKRELPRLINDAAMLVRRPFRFIWDPSIKTASTDCLAEIRVSPRPFLEGEREVGYGTVYHETGHIRFSPYGGSLLHQANQEGGEVLQTIANIILDRKDDTLTIQEAPGFAETLRKRLLVIRTLARRERYKHLFGDLSLKEQSKLLRNFKPTDPYEDFFLAAKCGKTPRLQATKKAMKYVRLSKLVTASSDELLWISKKVKEILGKGIQSKKEESSSSSGDQDAGSGEGKGKQSGSERQKAEKKFLKLWHDAETAYGGKLEKEKMEAIKTVVKNYLGGLRNSRITELLRKLSSMGITYPGSISVGVEKGVSVKKVPSDPKYLSKYQDILQQVQPLLDPMLKALRNISTPSEFELYGRDEGDLDLTEVSRIAARLSGFYTETVVERDIDAEIHLAIDCSGSTAGMKIERAKGIAVVFSEAITVMDPSCFGRIWSFNSETICDYGKPNQSSGFVTLEGAAGNSDTHMLQLVGAELLRSQKRRKILFVLCDDGPDDIEMVRKLSQQLTARGVIVIHLLIGVHGTPDIYPIELLYTSMKECLEEFGTLLQTIISHLK